MKHGFLKYTFPESLSALATAYFVNHVLTLEIVQLKSYNISERSDIRTVEILVTFDTFWHAGDCPFI